MMEVVMIAEEILPISVTNEELTHLRTLGDVQAFILAKTRHPASGPVQKSITGNSETWSLVAVGEEVRQLEARASQSIPRPSS